MSTQIRKAVIYVEWQDRAREPKQIDVQYNPTEFTLDKQVTLGEVGIPGLDAPVQQFVRGNAEKLTLDLFFDTTEHGMGAGAVGVNTETDKVYQLLKIEPERHAPPVLTFVWNDQFPGSTIGGAPGNVAGAAAKAVSGAAMGLAASVADTAVAATGSLGAAALGIAGPALGNQRRNGFRCVLESIKQKFTLFSPDGVPLRATLTVTLREYKTLNDQLEQLNLSSPDRTHAHVLAQSESLSQVAFRYYERCGDWRAVADQNAIDDPRRLTIGRVLEIPKLP
ncbi:MAG: phage tail protein [Gammaproteobacteria bacterium]|nr:phage tail protein [Gammaproteobacteria bacterium]MDH4311670.1 phage tail protein [Gammaproteobacteria bacterium]MDH5274265.1 phage tail protein [Gammaproteobacteria bacterium]